MWYAQLDASGIFSRCYLWMTFYLDFCLFVAVVVIKCFMIGVNVWWVYLAPQNIPRAISVLTLGNKVVLYCIVRTTRHFSSWTSRSVTATDNQTLSPLVMRVKYLNIHSHVLLSLLTAFRAVVTDQLPLCNSVREYSVFQVMLAQMNSRRQANFVFLTCPSTGPRTRNRSASPAPSLNGGITSLNGGITSLNGGITSLNGGITSPKALN